MRSVSLSFGLLGCMLLLAGCQGGSDPDRNAVKGEVTFKGKPLPSGNIQFIPQPDPGTGPRIVPIENGSYEIPRDTGLKPGTYKVSISSAQGAKIDPNEPPGESGPPPKDLIPPEYNVKSTKTVEVKAGETNQFDFHIK